MRQLFFTNYMSGRVGLSNSIMSIECAVMMAFLTKRFLLLDGNTPPLANLVDYDGRVDNSRPSRVTDLMDIPVPWSESAENEVAHLDAEELTQHSLMDTVFHVPGSVDIGSQDAVDFARGRTEWVGEDPRLAEVPLLRVSELPLVPGRDQHRNNLCFYSYLFYLDPEHRKAVYNLLTRMQAQAPYAELAQKVAFDLGDFNAIHMRRGDFKVTYGVTVLDRQPWEAIDAMDHHFDRDDRLLICTDERDDPFFHDIKQCFNDHVFVDHHILDYYAAEFAALPQNDSLALAYLSQLVAAYSKDFIGSMTSTYTGMIQRLRGNRGVHEPFKFLWNELPDPGDTLERGSHPVSNCVPLEQGIMVPEFDGPYSWNHYSPLINPAWMREWPESFLTPEVLASGRFGSAGQQGSTQSIPQTSENAYAYFEGLRFRIKSTVPGLAKKLTEMLYDDIEHPETNVIADIEVKSLGKAFLVRLPEAPTTRVAEEAEVPGAILKKIIPLLARTRRHCCWLAGMALRRSGKTILVLGDWSAEDAGIGLADALGRDGWQLLGDTALPLRTQDWSLVPFTRIDNNYGQPSLQDIGNPTIDAIVYCARQLQNHTALFQLSPSAAVAEMTRSSITFPSDRDTTIKNLCKLAESIPVYQLCYSHLESASAPLESLFADSDAVSQD
ncbi:hypothetical protein NOR51B_1280 [Luminiphilus syltensis NOR5-1B]|uniref:Uncharacterized protein n=1 Tax=Luminiphilus syltensis NOR5-1B TaxID=565045 RepID=B8KYM2_9GAMM|nr:hypothetical protein [Luminiphilus syltensis]EED35335.1 hypothetical protein NOR51B_1280 [Luminiphilus syltensis NOR5-1B]